MAVITLSRQYGSAGDQIAARVAVLLGYHIFDKTVMAKMAAEVGLTEQEVVDFSETDYRTKGLLDRLFGVSPRVGETRTWTEDIKGVRKPEVVKLSDTQAATMVRGIIEAAYKHGDMIIIGRGGQAVLKDCPGVLHVRVEAPLEQRIERIAKEESVEPLRAEWLIDDRDRAAREYVRRFHGIDPNDPMHYHLLINGGLLDVETAAQVIVLAVQQMKPVSKPKPLPRPVPSVIYG